MAKKLTLTILALAFLIGSLGAWFKVFDMEGFIAFLKGFAPLYISLIASIGANSAVEKYKETKCVDKD